ncbi:uncharacterized protein BX664DRAFT_327924 [Halteromyces radiatus]|uniref:uncharacterized protein n=1 Tax=Halteromyces radiatus TaxID=101107 RepID=UPI00221E84BC|nr:uncharacterized protein BX664DRAFT_327924 [Halteromyces radiatus]KAI8092698.1 hypothetical protein BX664DRAFT_327924 [Halteromyces radiatus]
MHLGLLSNDRLSFDPLKPVILSGPSSEEGSVVFSGNVVLSLGKTTKVSKISVILKSVQTTYWPEGIGSRGTRLSYEKTLKEDICNVFQAEGEKKGYVQLPAGIHRFMFTFVVPNSTVETVEDVYGRVKHTVEARVTSPGIPLLNSWHISKPVLVLRTYLSNALLTNNSIQDLSRTFEKHLPGVDIQIMVEQAAFSSGDLFHVRCVIQPQVKHVRLEHLEFYIIENRRYAAPEMRALRTDQERFDLSFLSAGRLEENDNGGELSTSTPDINSDWSALFTKNNHHHHHYIDIHDTVSYRLTFATPTCVRNLHHSTTFKDILFRHHLSIHVTLSYPDPTSVASNSSPLLHNHSFSSNEEDPMAAVAARLTRTTIHRHNSDQSTDSFDSTTSASNTSTGHHSGSSTPTTSGAKWLSKLRKHRVEKDMDMEKRKRETIKFESPITVFDCRLKEDFGRLPSYFELPQHNTNANGLSEKGRRMPVNNGDSTTPSAPGSPIIIQQDEPYNSSSRRSSCSIEAHVFLCPCYFAFRRQVERASEVQLYAPSSLSSPSTSTSLVTDGTTALDRIPSKPPPDYYVG